MRVAVIITTIGALLIFAVAISVTACLLPNDRQGSESGQTASQPKASSSGSESGWPESVEPAYLYPVLYPVLHLNYDDRWVANIPEFIDGYRVLTVYTPKSAACMDEPLITFHATQKSLDEYLAVVPDMNSLRAAVLAIPGVPSDIRLSFAGAPLDESGEPPGREEYALREMRRNEIIARVGCADYRIDLAGPPKWGPGPDTSVVPTGETGGGNLSKETSLDDKSRGDDANLADEEHGEEANRADKGPDEETNEAGGEGPGEDSNGVGEGPHAAPDSDGEKVSKNAVVVNFPQQDGTLGTEEEMERFVGKLVLVGRCLRVDSAIRHRDNAYFPLRPMIIWPNTFTLRTEDDVVGIANSAGRFVARVGDDVQLSAAAVTYGEALDQGGQEDIPNGCPGPYWVVGDDLTAATPGLVDEHTELMLLDPKVYFYRWKHIERPVQERPTGLTLIGGELVLDGHCLRLKGDHNDEGYLMIWPSGSTPDVNRGVVQVRNRVGYTIAQIGDKLFTVSATQVWPDDGRGECPGPSLSPYDMWPVSDLALPFRQPTGDQGLADAERPSIRTRDLPNP